MVQEEDWCTLVHYPGLHHPWYTFPGYTLPVHTTVTTCSRCSSNTSWPGPASLGGLEVTLLARSRFPEEEEVSLGLVPSSLGRRRSLWARSRPS